MTGFLCSTLPKPEHMASISPPNYQGATGPSLIQSLFGTIPDSRTVSLWRRLWRLAVLGCPNGRGTTMDGGRGRCRPSSRPIVENGLGFQDRSEN